MANVYAEIRRQDFLNCEAWMVPTNRKVRFEKCGFTRHFRLPPLCHRRPLSH